MFEVDFAHDSLLERLHGGLAHGRSPQLRELWLAAFASLLRCIWLFRNRAKFDGVQANVINACRLIIGQICSSNRIGSG